MTTAKTKIIFSCSQCGAQYSAWQGRCFECTQWGTIQKEIVNSGENKKSTETTNSWEKDILNLGEITENLLVRFPCQINEIDRVLGGGIVKDSFILLAGNPGVGKSTFILQLINQMIPPGEFCFYISGEETALQIKNRASRLGINLNKIKFLGETSLSTITSAITKIKPFCAIIDSIQTIRSDEIPSEPGNVSQIKACAATLLETAKKNKTIIFAIGHITKDGSIAGPKTLEHLVDVVLYLEQPELFDNIRVLKANKNRYGSTEEIGLFTMEEKGLKPVDKTEEIFYLPQNIQAPGLARSLIMEGSYSFLTEVQTLITKTFFGYPQRKSAGFDLNRLQMLTAMLTKRLKLPLAQHDIHLNIIGGLKTADPALDLAICASLLSGLKNIIFDSQTIFIGEVGLLGEVRPIKNIHRRVKEAEKLGFKTIFAPKYKTGSNKNLVMIESVKELIN